MAIKLTEQPNDVELTQVTTDPREKSNIYCELPYCSVDSRAFVYEQKNPETEPNATEYISHMISTCLVISKCRRI